VKVVHGRGEGPVVQGSSFAPHTGDVQLDVVLNEDGVIVTDAYFAAGARTHWHVHEHGQLISVTAGKGAVGTKDGEVIILQAGDTVHTPAGEVHWHGAAPDCYVTYRSVSLGRADTADEVPESEYRAVWA
jgi:quercetin dioxygenase-like cupin family protein